MRKRRDGTATRKADRRKLTELFVRKVQPEPRLFCVWDAYQRGLALRVTPNGCKSWKAVYRHHNRPRWFHIGSAGAVGLSDARRIAAEVMLEAARGKDPAAERRAQRNAGTFGELAQRYVEEYAKRKNKSWQAADATIRKHVMPYWSKIDAKSITRADVRALVSRIEGASMHNQTLASISAIYSWAMRMEIVGLNPCHGVEGRQTRSRERILSDGEVPRFWQAFSDLDLMRGSALKVLLLSGQRPGEVCHMRVGDIADGWWTLQGLPIDGWPGTKNAATHKVYLPEAAREIITECTNGSAFVFANRNGEPVGDLDLSMRQVCDRLGVNAKATPHDLRRTHGSTVTRLGFGRDAMNRIQNHKEGGISDVYDVHQYRSENQKIMEAVAAHFLSLINRD
jgi:integrase